MLSSAQKITVLVIDYRFRQSGGYHPDNEEY